MTAAAAVGSPGGADGLREDLVGKIRKHLLRDRVLGAAATREMA